MRGGRPSEPFESTHGTVPAGQRVWAAVTAVIVLAGTIGSTLSALAIAHADSAHARHQLGQRATQIAASVRLAIGRENDLLASERAFVSLDPTVSNAAFAHWSATIQAMERYPELVGWGETVIVPAAQLSAFAASLRAGPPVGTRGHGGTFRVIPPGKRPFYCLLRLGQARGADGRPPAGFDFCAGPAGAANLRARDTGRGTYAPLRIGHRIWLGVELPIYRGGLVPTTVAARRRAFLGWVGMGTFPSVVLDRALTGQPGTAVALRYRRLPGSLAFRAGPRLHDPTTWTGDLGRGWRIQVAAVLPSDTLLATPPALGALVGGVVLAILLAALVYVLGTGRARALALVRRRTEELRHQTLHDDLTGLPNRGLVMDRIGQLLVRARRSLTTPALLFIDVDDFKDVNDTFGHLAGDVLLHGLAARLAGAVREGDTVGRLGGDEFVIVAECSLGEEGADALVERVHAALAAPFELPGAATPVTVSVSIGVAVGERALPEQLLHDADLALYQAKSAGKHRSAPFRPTAPTTGPTRRRLEEDLHQALGSEQLFLAYEPVVDLRSGHLTGVQARLGWRHPDQGVVSGAELLPLLDSTGLIGPIGAWTLRQACGQAARWGALGHPLEVAVDLSPRQLEDDGLVETLAAALLRSGLAREHLVLDLPESALLEVPNATSALLRRLRALGVRLAVDEFGTGYTSLAHLRQFPFDLLKIDAAVVKGAARSKEAAALLRTLVQLGRRLELRTLAAGIDEEAQRALAEAEGIDAGQGAIFGEPATAEEIEARLGHPAGAWWLSDGDHPGPAVAGPRR